MRTHQVTALAGTMVSAALVLLLFTRCKAVHAGAPVDAGSAAETTPLDVGAEIPDAKVRTADGTAVKLAKLVDGKPSLILFYRGGWCPYCTRHLAKIQDVEGEIRQLGYQILALSPDRPEKLAATREAQKLKYQLVSDSDMAAARAFGLSFKVDAATKANYRDYKIDLDDASGRSHGLLPVPAAFLVDASGRIRFSYSNPDYKVRLEPEALLAAAKAAKSPLSVFDFVVKDAQGKAKPLADYRGKALLIVNTASKCGFTSQYAGLEKLHQDYQERGLVVIGFPCNQFGGQEPGSDEQIQTFCSTKFGVTFPVMAKIEVNGDDAHPLYQHLKAQASGVAGTDAIKWNFTKFLVDADGKVVERYSSRIKPEAIATDIEKLLPAE